MCREGTFSYMRVRMMVCNAGWCSHVGLSECVPYCISIDWDTSPHSRHILLAQIFNCNVGKLNRFSRAFFRASIFD